jgi:hypothetical protein
MATALLHKYSAALPEKPGLFPIGNGTDIPADWQPNPRDYQPAALPTPFARAEAMTLVLQQSAPGDHPLWNHFRSLLLGLVGGVLRLVPDDLRDARYDNFGAALLQVDDGARYFSRIEMPGGGAGALVGATYRSCLLWPHARRAESQWNELAHAVQARESESIALLSQWREALRRQGRWSAQLVAWQRGVDAILGSTTATSLDTIREHAALVGPLWAVMPASDPTRPTQIEPIYLPTLEPNRFARFRDLLQAIPRRGADGASLEIADQGGVWARIETPRVAADASPLALGAGNLRLESRPGAPAEGEPRIAELDELLEPVRLALHKEGRATDSTTVRTGLGLYPDTLRLLEQLKEAAAPADLLLTTRLQVLALQGKRLPTEDGDDGASLEVAGKRLMLVDRVEGVSPFELRALGFIAFRVFAGELVLREGALCSVDGVAPSFSAGAMLAADAKHPLQPSDALYRAVAEPPPPVFARRLATLQRFVATYRSGEALLDKAARSFASWAWASGTPVAALGKRGDRSLPFRIGGAELRLARDPLLAP